MVRKLNLLEEIVSNFFEGKVINVGYFVKIYNILELDLSKVKEIYLFLNMEYFFNEDNIYFCFVKYGFYVFFLKLLEVIFVEKIEENLVNKVADYIRKIGFNRLELRE